jgi:hypothetical protein
MMNEEDYEGFDPIELMDDFIKAQRKAFIEGCEEGYNLLQTAGPDCLNMTEKAHAKEALRRMLGHFTTTEEYEKCSFIKKIYEDRYRGKITPTFIENI